MASAPKPLDRSLSKASRSMSMVVEETPKPSEGKGPKRSQSGTRMSDSDRGSGQVPGDKASPAPKAKRKSFKKKKLPLKKAA